MTNQKLYKDIADSFSDLYPVPEGHFAIAYWVPMEHRELFLATYKKAGIGVRFRYRGPRMQSVGRTMKGARTFNTMKGAHGQTYIRRISMAQQDCLIDDATHFSVYYHNPRKNS